MKKAFRIILPILLIIAIVLCVAWYLFQYDREFTRDVLLQTARKYEESGNHNVAAWFYDLAYDQNADNDAVAIELAEQYKRYGNYTKAEFTLTNAIADGGGVELYVALSKTFVEQDKLMDAANLLSGVTVPHIKEALDQMRPAAPAVTPDPGFYSQYIQVGVTAESGTLYVSTDGEYPSVAEDLYAESISLSDGENTIYAIAVGEDGLVSPLSIFGFTIGGVVEEVSFADSAVETAVRAALGVSETATVMTNDLWTIRSFTVPEGAADISDLKHMIYLEELNASGIPEGQISIAGGLSSLKVLSVTDTPISQEELAMIAGLPALEKLTLSGCGLTSSMGLTGATKLVYLDISENTVRNIGALTAMTGLKELYLSHNALESLDALSTLSELTVLDISHNSVQSLSPICGLTTLTTLKAGTNKLTGTAGMEALTALSVLDLSYNDITEISYLSSCTKLTEVNVSNNELTDISSLANAKALRKLDFSYNQVTALPGFEKSCALISIDGSHNVLKSIDQLGGLENLNDVYMDYNEELASVSALKDCPCLILVNVYGTKVTEVKMLTEQSVIVNYNPVQEED